MGRFDDREWTRRGVLQATGTAAAALLAGGAARAADVTPAGAGAVSGKLPRLSAPTEPEEEAPKAPLAPDQRMGFAVVGLGRLALDQVLPAFAESKRCRVAALVSGDRAKAAAVAARYGVGADHLYDYRSYDKLRDDKLVNAVYIALPNGLHAEYTIRAAQAGKHVLCEKPMANTVVECQQMIDASAKAGKHLMVAYRMQYEPFNREAIRMASAGELGKLKGFSAMNCQAQGDPRQWRLKKALAGGGALPDLGIYCLNAARYLGGEEPVEVTAMVHSTPGDPRFSEVEEQVDFVLAFPSGFLASCTTSYAIHNSKRYRLLGESAFVELDPAFPYRGQQMRVGRKNDKGGGEVIETRQLPAKNHFALELDHLAERIQSGRKPHTPGEEGMQDMKVIAAIYEAAREGRRVTLPAVKGRNPFRGPPPT
jgi:predicted dehydrogenase